MKKQLKLSMILLMTIGLFACQSQANRVRSEHALACKDVSIPLDAKIREGDIITYKSKIYVPSERYIALAGHSAVLAECGRISQCVIRWTEYERDCEIEQRTFLFYITGIKKKCTLERPDC
jgi:hypothetical protein